MNAVEKTTSLINRPVTICSMPTILQSLIENIIRYVGDVLLYCVYIRPWHSVFSHSPIYKISPTVDRQTPVFN